MAYDREPDSAPPRGQSLEQPALPGHLKVLCILPAYNEAGKIGRVVRKVTAVGGVDRIVVVDDCSGDQTSVEAREAGAHVIRHEFNRGVGAGIRTGLTYGRQNGFDIAVIMSGDDQHEPKELPPVLRKLSEGRDLFVQGSRRLKGGKTVNAPLFREFATRLHALVFTLVTGHRITDSTNGFRAFYLDLLDDPRINLDQSWLDTYELEPYLLYKAVTSRHVKVVEMPITIYYHGSARQYTKMKPFRDWWRLSRPLFLLRLGIRR
ncbi:MAG TPA: glycosyltransferase family 2 protein [Candidatus Acidoferrum sp.]|nr:glycosyltransferase family 2 protein [Candidatus Acidoferrum sp.]